MAAAEQEERANILGDEPTGVAAAGEEEGGDGATGGAGPALTLSLGAGPTLALSLSLAVILALALTLTLARHGPSGGEARGGLGTPEGERPPHSQPRLTH